MSVKELLALYSQQSYITDIAKTIVKHDAQRINLNGLTGSFIALISSSIVKNSTGNHVFVLNDMEEAAYFLNDLENIFLCEHSKQFVKDSILFFPASFKTPHKSSDTDQTNIQFRAEVLSKVGSLREDLIIVTYPEALCEKVVSKANLAENTLKLHVDEQVSIDFIVDLFSTYHFNRVDFVVEPGQFSVRGGIVDVFSFANEYPYRIEFDGDKVASMRMFHPDSQLSNCNLSTLTIMPNVQDSQLMLEMVSFFQFLPEKTTLWVKDYLLCADLIEIERERYIKILENLSTEENEDLDKMVFPEDKVISKIDFIEGTLKSNIIEFGSSDYFKADNVFHFNSSPQPAFNKNFYLLKQNLDTNSANNYKNIILADTAKQCERLYNIFESLDKQSETLFTPLLFTLHEGFIDRELKLVVYTDYQIFGRYQHFNLRNTFATKESVTLKELQGLQPGDYVTHIDHGIGRFAGLEKMEVNGKQQEAIKLVYQEGDLLYVSIHSLHRISKYTGKEGAAPSLSRLGSNVWSNLKEKTKRKVKEIAIDLIKLYAERRAKKGFQFSPDNYLQTELEASFIYEDTPDQLKSTQDVKKDMESEHPMDRLICGDVGFGKTEIAVRAAFKAVCDSKQVAILVPTTILALQHFYTFKDRLKDFPCNIEYVNRFKNPKEQKEVVKKLAEGTVDIIIGTHRLLSKDIEFKNLGLLVIDEEQKFGVAAKEKIKTYKTEVDTLTLTATPIPRTMQFSLMGARDLSIINTPPPNRYPIQTEIHVFSEELIKEAIITELARGGQVFFIHNRVQNITEVADVLKRLCPQARIAIGHGQMEGQELEHVMTEFIDHENDILVSTTIVESGLDIPNANTIIINNAHNFGLSDLHQMRGRVGRANRKAYCYILTPPLSTISSDARKRLQAIETFSELGSGFNIAMRDLDIRGAGNLLGGEQSGFIMDIGYEAYLKILDEAIQELKEKEFKDVFVTENIDYEFVKDCQIESDLEILIPDDYVSEITERLNLYKDLDSIETEEKLLSFEAMLIDRFGSIPRQTVSLINTIRLRWVAKEIGLEKLVLKMGKLICYFVSNPESPYFQSSKFAKVLNYLKNNPTECKMKENKNRLSLVYEDIKSINKALQKLRLVQGVGEIL